MQVAFFLPGEKWGEKPWKMLCRYCDLPCLEENYTFSYWSALKFAAHKACKNNGEADEAYECQSVDRDCNDCVFFKRGTMTSKGVFDGFCEKKQQKTKAYPKMCTGNDCFKHRKDK